MTATLTPTEVETFGQTIVVDARGVACPGPMIEAKKAMSSVPVGSVMELLSGAKKAEAKFDSGGEGK